MADEPSPDTVVEDDRLIRDTGTDARVAAIILPILRSMDFRLVRVRLSGQNGATLQVMVERPDGTITVEDCEEISRAISPTLDVEDPIEKAYHLEVSSPGIDRPLVRKSDFAAAIGHAAKIETSVMVADKKRFRGKITAVDDNGFTLERDLASYGDEPQVHVPFDTLAEARLILTDSLIREALSRDNQEKKAARRGAAGDDAEASETDVDDIEDDGIDEDDIDFDEIDQDEIDGEDTDANETAVSGSETSDK